MTKEHRNFGVLYGDKLNDKTPNDQVNGHTVTYLDRIFNRYAPNIYNKMLKYCQFADNYCKWNLLFDDAFGTKCIEYIQYKEKGDNLGWHCDMGSLVTIVIMLTNSNQYQGGIFQTRYLNKTINIPLECGDIVVFSSDKCNHRVTNLIQGKRVVLCMELIFW